MNQLQKLETITCVSSKSIVKGRIEEKGKLSYIIRDLLSQSFTKWNKKRHEKETSDTTDAQLFIRTLIIYARICELDFVLAQEIESCGGERIINELMKIVMNEYDTIEEYDANIDIINELCYTISSFSLMNAHKRSLIAFDNDELISRLPLVYNLPSFSCNCKQLPFEKYGARKNENNGTIYDSVVYINQVTQIRQTAQEDVGFVLWPSSIILSNYMLKHKSKYHSPNSKILELGSGCGLTGLTCAKEYNTKQVFLTDINLHVLSNLQRNVNINDLKMNATVAYLDFYNILNLQELQPQYDEQSSSRFLKSVPMDDIDFIIAADIICKEDDAIALSKFLYTYLTPNALALIVSAKEKHRFGVSIFADECRNIGLDVVVETLISSEEDESNMIQYAAGYVDQMEFYLYHVRRID